MDPELTADPTLDETLDAAAPADTDGGARPGSSGAEQEPSLEDALVAAFDAAEKGGEQAADAKPQGKTEEEPGRGPEQYKQFHDEVDAALAPWEPVLAAQGLSKPQAVKNLVNLYTASVQDPVGFLTGLGQRYAPTLADPAQRAALVEAFARGLGVDIRGEAPPQPNGQANGATNPIEQRLASIEQTIQAQREQQVQSLVARAQASIQEFVGAKDDKGQPLHPHFERVKGTMAALMQSGSAKNLENAYAQAVWTVPELRESLTKAQQAQQAQAAAEQRRQGIAKARAAQTPRTTSVPTPPEDISKLGLGEQLDRGWKELGLDAR